MLKVEGISKRFGGVQAVSKASLCVERDKITALIGPNGAGKTTFFAMVSGFVRPDCGRVMLEGADITGLPAHAACRRGVARTFQIVQPFAGLTVRENIAIGAHLHEASHAIALTRAEEIAVRVGMADQLDRPAQELTVAGRKRLELARALATRPKLLLLDEVMASLTPTEIDGIVEIIRDLHRSGIAILLIEHVMRAVMSLSDVVYVLSNGAMIAQGDPKQVTSDPRVVEAYLGQSAADAVRPGEHLHAPAN
jgi:branched-chain amino acid transport system ATP-binding protein